VRFHLPGILWCVLIFISSSIPSNRLPSVGILGFDKLVHFGIYLVLCFLLHRSFSNQARFPFIRSHSLVTAVLGCIAFGITDEIHQIFVPGRTSSVYDIFANALGGLTYSLYLDFRGRRRKKREIAPR
jgi:VanZ family protein